MIHFAQLNFQHKFVLINVCFNLILLPICGLYSSKKVSLLCSRCTVFTYIHSIQLLMRFILCVSVLGKKFRLLEDWFILNWGFLFHLLSKYSIPQPNGHWSLRYLLYFLQQYSIGSLNLSISLLLNHIFLLLIQPHFWIVIVLSKKSFLYIFSLLLESKSHFPIIIL